MNKISKTLLVLLITAVGYIVYDKTMSGSSHDDHTISEEKQLYTCGMHPQIISDEPGLCPICEMKLVPLKSVDKSETDEGIVKINPTVQQNMNIKTAVIKREELSKVIETNGILKIVEGNESVINSRFNGWIEKLYVDETNQFVRKGDPLYKIYSPQIYSASQELLTTIKSLKEKSISSEIASTYKVLKDNSIKKLRLLNVPQQVIDKIISTQKVDSVFTVYSPITGNLLMKLVVEGDYVKEGVKLFHIADLSKLWLIADIYENEIPFISKNDHASISFVGSNRTDNSQVDFVHPILENKTRTVKVRFVINNSNYELKPEMLAAIKINSSKKYNVITIEEQDLIRSGKQNIAVISLGDGKFKPIAVELGKYFDGKYEVLSGFKEGDVIVKSSQFLIDSESRLKSAYNSFSSGNHDHSTTNMTDEMNEENEYGIESELIRTGKIELSAIDKNKDGKLFECPMDWNIISDNSGRCPSCEMKLKEFTLEETKINLIENGYQVKE